MDITALIYHQIEKSPQSEYSISWRGFREQISWMLDNGYIVEGFRELETRLKTNVFPKRYVVLCFDDGHRSDLAAVEYLVGTRAQATFFVTTGLVGTSDKFLEPKHVAEISCRFGIGSHAVSHRPLVELNEHDVRAELKDSRTWLETQTKSPITHLSMPNGSMNQRIVGMARKCGYTLIGGSREALSRSGTIASTRVVHRIAVRNGYNVQTMAKILQQQSGWFLRRRFRRVMLYLPKLVLKDNMITAISECFSRR